MPFAEPLPPARGSRDGTVRQGPERGFEQRPYWLETELDRECERLVLTFLRRLRGKVEYPISTDDLKTLIEEDARDLDQYADLSAYGADVEGVTEFEPGRKPRVRISSRLAEDERRENRLRTTLTHESGHVRFHGYLFEAAPRTADLVNRQLPKPRVISCKRGGLIDAPKTDWMEWQAGHISGAILMPVTAVRVAVGAVQERLASFGPVTPGSNVGREMIAAMMGTFQVSADAARVRLFRLGHLAERHAAAPSLLSHH